MSGCVYAETLGSLDSLVAAARGHPDVGDDDIGCRRLHRGEQRVEILARGDDLQLVRRLEQPLQALADEKVVFRK